MKKFKRIVLSLLACSLILSVLWCIRFVYIHESNKDGLPVLGYHNVVEDDVKDKYYKWDVYVMSKSQFKEQMKYLYDNKFQTLSMEEVYDAYMGKKDIFKKAVVITFDDGYESFHTIVEPILREYKMKATCFVIGEKVGKSTHKVAHEYLKKSDLKDNDVVSYYSHSYSMHHKAKGFDKKKMDNASYKDIEKDFNKNKNIVSDEYFAFPYGRSNEDAQKYLKQSNVKLAFGYNQNRNMQRDDNQYLLPRYLMFSKMPLFYFEWLVE